MQKDLLDLLKTTFEQNTLIQGVFSNPRKKGEFAEKVSVRPLASKESFLYQITKYKNNQALHENLNAEASINLLLEICPFFKQGNLKTTGGDYHLLINKKGEVKILKKAASEQLQNLSHNRQKAYLLPDGVPEPFLIKLGLMNASGKVLPQKMDKFRQINRFLEMVDDTLPHLDKEKGIHVVDFGCGKSYLTFALYHFLHVVRGRRVHLIGLDLKKDVIALCQSLAKELKYEGLSFHLCDVADYESAVPIDMVVCLHACNTATDVALEKAIRWQSKVILAAPCCQHELYPQVYSKLLEGFLRYGILKERFSALVTDAVRALLLEMCGYTAQILEFIDSAHTPKNLLIRAVLGNKEKQQNDAKRQYELLQSSLRISPKLGDLLKIDKKI